MLDPRYQLMLIKADREREIAAASRARLTARQPHVVTRWRGRISLAMGLRLVRLGWWILGPDGREAPERSETA